MNSLHVSFMKALADTGDTSTSTKAFLVRRLWRSHDPEVKQAARVLLNIFKPAKKMSKGLSVAQQIKAELLERGEDWVKPRRNALQGVYGTIADRLGLSDRTVKEYFERYRAKIPEAEVKEQQAQREKRHAEAKMQMDALFYAGAAKWDEEK